jgi:hypothetical protein
MMRKLLLILSLTCLSPLNLRAFDQFPLKCDEENQLKGLKDFEDILGNMDYPKMKVKYTLAPDCKYTLESRVIVPAQNKSPKQMIMEYMSPNNNLSSANRDILKNQTFVSSKKGFIQTSKVTKSLMSATVQSKCNYTLDNPKQSEIECNVLPENSKIDSWPYPQIINHGTSKINCSYLSTDSNYMDCKFSTIGRSNRILHRSACSLAAGGATESFEGIYRLSHYITHKNVRNISAAKAKIDEFYNAASSHGSIGRSEFTIEKTLK